MTPLILAWLRLALVLGAHAAPKAVELEIAPLQTAVKPALPSSGLNTAITLPGGAAVLPTIELPATAIVPETAVPEAQTVWTAAPLVNQQAVAQGQNAWIAAPVGGDVSAEQAVEAGRLQFDHAVESAQLLVSQAPQAPGSLEQLVSHHAQRPLRGVFVQNEQEGSLLQSDHRDSTGNFFRWYRPVEMRPDLVAKVESEMNVVQKTLYNVTRAFKKKGEYAAWNSFSTDARLSYLDKLEKAVVAEKGRAHAWDGKVSLLLEKIADAPAYLTKNPHMEAPPSRYKDVVGAKFFQPELVTDKNSPAATVNEALGRTSYVISQTGHAGTQYHVFLKIAPEQLKKQLVGLQDALQLFNDVLFARAAKDSIENVAHASLNPWHAGRSRRVAKLVQEAKAGVNTPAAEDADSEKHAFVGFRYWGVEDGKLVVSLELRGANLPWKQERKSAARDMGEIGPPPKRDYAEAKRFLTFIALYAEKLSQGRAPKLPHGQIELEAKTVDVYLWERSRALGIPENAFYGIEEFSRRIMGSERVAPGFLFPFLADPKSASTKALADALIRTSARMKASDARDPNIFAGERRTQQYLFWEEYRAWASGFAQRREGELERLFRVVAAD